MTGLQKSLLTQIKQNSQSEATAEMQNNYPVKYNLPVAYPFVVVFD